jgi:hypothetical protein
MNGNRLETVLISSRAPVTLAVMPMGVRECNEYRQTHAYAMNLLCSGETDTSQIATWEDEHATLALDDFIVRVADLQDAFLSGILLQEPVHSKVETEEKTRKEASRQSEQADQTAGDAAPLTQPGPSTRRAGALRSGDP